MSLFLPSIPSLNIHAHMQGSGDKFFFDSDSNDDTKISIYTCIDSKNYYLQLTPDGKNPVVGLSDKPDKYYNFVFPAA